MSELPKERKDMSTVSGHLGALRNGIDEAARFYSDPEHTPIYFDLDPQTALGPSRIVNVTMEAQFSRDGEIVGFALRGEGGDLLGEWAAKRVKFANELDAIDREFFGGKA